MRGQSSRKRKEEPAGRPGEKQGVEPQSVYLKAFRRVSKVSFLAILMALPHASWIMIVNYCVCVIAVAVILLLVLMDKISLRN